MRKYILKKKMIIAGLIILFILRLLYFNPIKLLTFELDNVEKIDITYLNKTHHIDNKNYIFQIYQELNLNKCKLGSNDLYLRPSHVYITFTLKNDTKQIIYISENLEKAYRIILGGIAVETSNEYLKDVINDSLEDF